VSAVLKTVERETVRGSTPQLSATRLRFGAASCGEVQAKVGRFELAPSVSAIKFCEARMYGAQAKEFQASRYSVDRGLATRSVS